MNEEQGEFDFEGFARKDDPETSKKSGARIKKANPKRFAKGTKKAINLAEYPEGDWTDTEVAIRVEPNGGHPSFEGTRRRCSDLRAIGFIEDTGERRKNKGSSDDSMVCKITEKGVAALKCLQETGFSSPKE